MLNSIWSGFLKHYENGPDKTPIVLSALKQLKPLGLTEDEIELGCENSGLRIYLDKRRQSIEKSLSIVLKKKTKIKLTLIEPRSKKDAGPLLSYQPSMQDVFHRAGLHNKYRFDNFAVSSTNQVAHAAAQAVAQSPGNSYNPLFFYGGVGVGKTHLAQAVGRTILEKDHEKKVFFCPGDQFTNELIEGIRERTTMKFRKKYRYLDLLIVDDIQFIAGKEAVQEEFFHTFNSVVSAGGQIILTSDRPLSAIKNLEDRLRSRFSGGLMVDVQQPDFELRTAIILIKAREKNIELDINAARIIAEQVSDVRALEGSLLSIYAQTLGKKEGIDLDVVEAYFQEKKDAKPNHKIGQGDIMRAVCSFYNIRPSHLKSASRSESVSFPRHIIMYLLRTELKLKFEEIAYILKRKDHTTIMHGVDKISGLIIKNPTIKEEVGRIISSLTSST